MEDTKSCEIQGWLVVRQLANVIEHLVIGLIVYSMIQFAAISIGTFTFYTIDSFQLHIMFSVCGYQLLMVEAILSFSQDGPMGTVLSRQTKRIVHMVLGSLGIISSLTGAILGFDAHGAKFDTAHGICGLIALIFSLLSCVNGFLAFFSPQLRDKVTPANIKAVHTICGSVAVTMGLVTLILGINKPQLFVAFNGRETATCLIVFIVLVLLYSLIVPMKSMKGYINNMRSTVL